MDNITLKHTQQQGINTIAEADKITVSVKANDKRDFLAPGISGKWGKRVVGYGKNGLGEQTFPDIVVTEPIELTLKKCIEDELTVRGFHVNENADFMIEIDINKMFNDYRVGLIISDSVADLNMDISVLSNTRKVLYSRNITVQGNKTWASTMRGEDARVSLNKALDNGINLLFSDGEFLSVLSHNK